MSDDENFDFDDVDPEALFESELDEDPFGEDDTSQNLTAQINNNSNNNNIAATHTNMTHTQESSTARASHIDPEDGPPVIEDVSKYFPNVAPDAFPVVISCNAACNFNMGIDLRKLACATRNVEYVPSFLNPCVTLRLQHPTATVQIRNSGFFMITGAHSLSEAKHAGELTARIVRRALDLEINSYKFKVRYFLARFNACSPVRVDDMAHHRFVPAECPGVEQMYFSYEPDRFPGCMIKMVGKSAKKDNNWTCSVTVFVTGKMSFLGVRSMEELRFGFDACVPIIAKYLGSTQIATEKKL